jgi:hypothetical protein
MKVTLHVDIVTSKSAFVGRIIYAKSGETDGDAFVAENICYQKAVR